MEQTIQELADEPANIRALLKEAHDGIALFIGYSGIGKTTTISCMLTGDALGHIGENQDKEENEAFIDIFYRNALMCSY